jgi:predicted N-formylglutamate amidohydrolase
MALGRPTILVAVHSFTPVFHGESRPWHVGVLYNRDARLARVLLELFRAESGIVVGDNQPYAVSDEGDYTIPIHGERRSIPHVELEIRQDLLADEPGQVAWADRLARALIKAEGLI